MSADRRTLEETAWALDLDCATADVVELLERARVPGIVLKGPALAAELYADGTPRPYFDTDLLVRAGDLPAVGETLRAHGYRLLTALADHAPAQAYDESWRRGWHLVEAHVRLLGTTVDPDRVWAEVEGSTRPLALAGRTVRTLGPDATALLLALHAAHHGLQDGGKALEDLRRGVAILGEGTWREAVALAGRLEAERELAWGLAQAPGGRELAARLGLRVAPSRKLLLRRQGSPLVATGLEELAAAGGARARLRLLRAKLLPPARVMRHAYGAGTGRRGLATAHARRWGRLARAAPRGLAAFAAASRGEGAGRAWALARSLRMGVRLGLLSRAGAHALDERYYSGGGTGHVDYADEGYNRRGLFDWEAAAVARHFPAQGRLLVIAAGGGREMLALAAAGHRLDGYECHPGLAAVANRLLAADGAGARVLPIARDAAPAGGGPYDGIVVGWAAYTLVQGRATRVRLLRDLRALAAPGAPLLLSCFGRDPGIRYGLVARVAGVLRRLRREEPVEHGDSLAESWRHGFTEEELRGELLESGWRPREVTMAGTPHAVASAA